MERATREFFEPRFGFDFSSVRLHNDAHADAEARSVNAVAYTIGRDIVFRHGAYAPWSVAGRRLLAHELTHVVQRCQGRVEGSSTMISRPGDPLELEAVRVENDLLRGDVSRPALGRLLPATVQPSPAGGLFIQRTPDGKNTPTEVASRLGIDLDQLEPVQGSDGHSFKPKGAEPPALKEVQLADQLAAEVGDEFVFPKVKNQAGIDGFLKKSGRPMQLKRLEGNTAKALARSVVSHANDAYDKAGGWNDVDLNIEARDATKATVRHRWNQRGESPKVKGMPGRRITRIRVHCQDGIVELDILGATPPEAVGSPTGATGGTPVRKGEESKPPTAEAKAPAPAEEAKTSAPVEEAKAPALPEGAGD